MIFETLEEVRGHLAGEYPTTKGKTLAGWTVNELTMLIGVYEGEDLIQGLIVYYDINRYKWIVLDNFHADLAVRYYAEYRAEFDDAIALFELVDAIEEDDEDDDLFIDTLD